MCSLLGKLVWALLTGLETWLTGFINIIASGYFRSTFIPSTMLGSSHWSSTISTTSPPAPFAKSASVEIFQVTMALVAPLFSSLTCWQLSLSHAWDRHLLSFPTEFSTLNVYSMFADPAQCLLIAGVFHRLLIPCLGFTRMADDQGSLLKFRTLQPGSVTMSFWISLILSTVQSPVQVYWSISIQCECQVWENCGGNSGNSRHQVWTYEMLDGTSASAYVLCPFQALVPRFWNEGDGVLE